MAAAWRYGDLSNAHDLQGIGAMIAPAATLYGNTGKAAILDGMRRFRHTYPKVWWTFRDWHAPSLNEVEFAFDRYWTDSATGGVLMCTAAEVIGFDADARMVSITYTEAPSAPVQVPGYPPDASPLDFVDAEPSD
uniref:SnoaL-like domain-containing protein n=1 Tax=Eutreptiella gymnastica TaxID=73025 RepID=A0A7S1JI92_9EUGL